MCVWISGGNRMIKILAAVLLPGLDSAFFGGMCDDNSALVAKFLWFTFSPTTKSLDEAHVFCAIQNSVKLLDITLSLNTKISSRVLVRDKDKTIGSIRSPVTQCVTSSTNADFRTQFPTRLVVNQQRVSYSTGS